MPAVDVEDVLVEGIESAGKGVAEYYLVVDGLGHID